MPDFFFKWVLDLEKQYEKIVKLILWLCRTGGVGLNLLLYWVLFAVAVSHLSPLAAAAWGVGGFLSSIFAISQWFALKHFVSERRREWSDAHSALLQYCNLGDNDRPAGFEKVRETIKALEKLKGGLDGF